MRVSTRPAGTHLLVASAGVEPDDGGLSRNSARVVLVGEGGEGGGIGYGIRDNDVCVRICP